MADSPYAWKQKIRSAIGRLVHHPNFLHGVVATPHGYVTVSAASLDESGKSPRASLRFMHNGTEYTRRVNDPKSERALAITAGRFAREIATGDSHA